jgi:hypothetical protein
MGNRPLIRPLRVALALTIAVLGLALLVTTLLRGGGATGLLLGLLFLAAGIGRLYLMRVS